MEAAPRHLRSRALRHGESAGRAHAPGRLSSRLQRPLQDHGMKTRDRILECALQLFNEQGEPNVSTLEIATEMGISPGNLYPLPWQGAADPAAVQALPEPTWRRCSIRPQEAELGAVDYWLFLHLIVERLAQYRFLFQDLSNLSGRLPSWLAASACGSTSSSAPWPACWPDSRPMASCAATPGPRPAGRADHPDPAVLPRLSAHPRRPGRSPSGGVPGDDAGHPAPHRRSRHAAERIANAILEA